MRDSYVIDSNIIFDLDHGNLLSQFFQLPINVISCDLIQLESLSVSVSRLVQLGLSLHSVTGETFTEITMIRGQYPGLSIVDISSVLLARDTHSCLLSGDKALATYAKSIPVSVHGVLWVLDELFAHNLVISSEACAALKAILANGARLPQNIVNQRLKFWC